MTRWIVEEPTELTFDEVDAVKVSIVGGHVAILATEGAPRLEVGGIRQPPLVVAHDGGRLTVGYDDWPWDGLRRWIGAPRRAAVVTVAVPRECRVQVAVVSASATVAGIQVATSIRTVSGDVALDGLTGRVQAQTVSGDIEAQALGGSTDFSSISGDVTVSSGPCPQLRAKTVSGKIITDLDLAPGGTATLASMSGDITVRLPGSAGAAVDLCSVSGRIGAAFPDLTRARHPAARAARRTLGDGSSALAATTVSGDIALLRRDVRETATAGGAT